MLRAGKGKGGKTSTRTTHAHTTHFLNGSLTAKPPERQSARTPELRRGGAGVETPKKKKKRTGDIVENELFRSSNASRLQRLTLWVSQSMQKPQKVPSALGREGTRSAAKTRERGSGHACRPVTKAYSHRRQEEGGGYTCTHINYPGKETSKQRAHHVTANAYRNGPTHEQT